MSEPIAQFSGLASGIKSSELIDAIITARESENLSRKAEIEHLNSENSALDELNTKILALADLIDQFRSVNGGGLRKKVSSTDSDIVTATATASALSSTTSMQVTSLANTATASFNPSTPYTSESSVLSSGAGTGNVSVIVGTGSNQKTVTVSVDGGSTTIRQFVDAFNANSNAEGMVSASLVNVGTTSSPTYKVTFHTLNGGLEKGKIAFSVDPIHNTQLGSRTIEQATNAKFTIGGISGSIERSTNSIDDVITGLTLQLKDTGSVSLAVSEDAESTLEQMKKIIDSYNEIVNYVAENDTITETQNTSGTTTLVYGSLAKSRVDNGLLTDFRSRFAEATATDGVEVSKFSELGIKTNRDGTLTIDEDKFSEALSADPTGAYQVITSFADSATGPTGFLTIYTQYQGLIDVAQKGNSNTIDNLQEKINQVERSAASEREVLRNTFAGLEKTSAELQQRQSQITTMISSLG